MLHPFVLRQKHQAKRKIPIHINPERIPEEQTILLQGGKHL